MFLTMNKNQKKLYRFAHCSICFFKIVHICLKNIAFSIFSTISIIFFLYSSLSMFIPPICDIVLLLYNYFVSKKRLYFKLFYDILGNCCQSKDSFIIGWKFYYKMNILNKTFLFLSLFLSLKTFLFFFYARLQKV